MRAGLVCILLITVVFSGFAQQSEDWYQGKPIRDIIFEGLENVKISELEGITEPYIGRIFSDQIYWDILGSLYALEYFETIVPTAVRADPLGAEVVIRFTVVERPIISRIIFMGNSGLRRSELLDAVTMKISDVATQIKLQVDEMAIINKYLEKGYPDIKVRSEMAAGPGGGMIVTFNIEEGEKITVEEFLFEGNSVFSSRNLRGQLSLETKGFIADGAFQEAKLAADRQALVQYYHDRGYMDAEVVDVARKIRKDEKGNNNMTITFRIYEGRIYTFGGVRFEGNKIFSTEQLEEQIYSAVGDIINERKIQADLMRVADLYYENGYIFNRIEPIPERNLETGVIAYKIEIVERGRAHIENIIIRGNKKTKDEVILREIPLEEGDVFSKAKLMDGLRNLYNLQYFSMVTPDIPQGSADSLMNLVVNVEEQPTTDIQFGLTFSGTADPDAFPVSGLIKWTDRNFMGTGNVVGAEMTGSPDTQAATLEYTHKWMLGIPLSGSFDFTVQHITRYAAMDIRPPIMPGNDEDKHYFPDPYESWEEYVNAGKIPPDEFLMPYDQWRLSLGLGAGYRWLTGLGNLGLGGGVRLGMIYSDYDPGLYRPFDPVLRERNNRWTPATSVWTSLSLDQRDIYYDPSSGYYGIQRIGYYGLFGIEEEHYVRADTKVEWYYTLFNIPVTESWNFKAVFGIHSGLSFIFRQPAYDKPVIENANKLAVDGMFIGRGWTGEYSNKGLALWENWAEVRFPVVPGILAWDFFFDAAGIKETPWHFFNDFSTNDGSGAFFMRFSFGGGFRFTIPQFPFRFSLAKRFKVVDGEVVWMDGDIGRNPSKPGSGLNFVISFAMSTY